MEYFRSHRHTVNKSRSASIVVGYVNTSEVGVVLGFLFAFCTCVSLNFNSELFLAPYLYVCIVSLRSPRISRIRKRKLLSRILFLLMNDTYDFKSCVALHVRIANRLVTDSCCRGGIVHIRGGCSRALFVRRRRSKALWRFRVSTSNSPSGRSWQHTNTHTRHIYHTCAQQGIRVCGVDHFEPRKRQYSNPKLSLLRVSI